MSDEVVISVENLSKRYRLGQIGATSLRESAERWWHKMRGRNPEVEMGEVSHRGTAAVAEGFRLRCKATARQDGEPRQSTVGEVGGRVSGKQSAVSPSTRAKHGAGLRSELQDGSSEGGEEQSAPTLSPCNSATLPLLSVAQTTPSLNYS